ncbi:phenylpyruvate tautomerase MIF-related protein [Streptococcus thoraltensis]
MPFIMMKTSQTVTQEEEVALKTAFGQAISCVPGKSEQVLLVGIEGDYSFYLRGEKSSVAYIEISLFDTPEHRGYASMTSLVTRAVEEILGTPKEQIYLHFHDIAAWGVAGYYMEANR